MKLKLYIQKYGNGVAIGMQGHKPDIERQCNSYFNHKVTNCDPIWMSDKFAYIITTEDLLMRGLISCAMLSLQGTRAALRVIRGGERISLLPLLAEQKALNQLKRNFTNETFLNELELCHN